MSKRVLLVGTISNVARTLEKELKIVMKALLIFDSVEVFLVESDSVDATITILNKIKSDNKDFQFRTLGKIQKKYPNRIERIAYCRNIYVRYIQDNYKKRKWDYVVVADLDGMNLKLTKKAIESCFEIDSPWDGLMANQKFGYYDLYALRAENWIEEDCFLEMNRVKSSAPQPKLFSSPLLNFVIQFIYFDKFRKHYIYDRMKIIKPNSDLIKVSSAFGGFAVYNPRVFFSALYKPSDLLESEHVYFHEAGNNSNKLFYINPSLINNHINPYNINRWTFIRFLRELKKYLGTVRNTDY
jgi:hypothetical protein